MSKLVTCEQVFRGHPDKICDQISDAILDACLSEDKNSRVAVETAIKNNQVWVFGEITTNANPDYSKIVRRVLKDIGYNEKDFTTWITISKQSNDIAVGVDNEGAGDQGMMYGYAELGKNYMPAPFNLATTISKKYEELRKGKYSNVFLPDGKCQVTAKYSESNVLLGYETIVVSAQTKVGVTLDRVKEIITNEILIPILGDLDGIRVLINPTGVFNVGGPYADAGLTGRKIICDTYGGVAHHGGGAFSGKDPSKVDRSAAYYARYVARCLVSAGYCTKCEVGVSYSIGIDKPVSISVDTFGTNTVLKEEILNVVRKNFNFTPSNIKKELKLTDIKYENLACYGHFGREELNVPWEVTYAKAREISKK